ncbi:hypothetical protein B5S33_g3452 [[Candida] boidinii]|nr:hypothetical protein B5S30_g4713 [[Candida] boidinii]OWB84799.1 hypothetical protein B5S33_g3452 [[Candida] boidinii]GMG17718.1 unnamed protein product [[Candida] boidinii]
MYNYRAPNSRTPEEFTENARKKVLNDLISSKLSSNFSHIRYHQDQCDSFVKSQRNPLQHQTHQQQVEIQGKERHVANHNDSKDLSSIFTKFKKSPFIKDKHIDNKSQSQIPQNLQPPPQTIQSQQSLTSSPPPSSCESSPPTSNYASSTSSPESTIIEPSTDHSYNLSRVESYSSYQSSSHSSIFSKNSSTSYASSISDYDNRSIITPSSTSSCLSNTPISHKRIYIDLRTVLDTISNHPNENIGNIVFNDLNDIIKRQSTNSENSPERCLDWNLNLMRVLLFINRFPNNLNQFTNSNYNSLISLYTKINDKQAIKNLNSELYKMVSSYYSNQNDKKLYKLLKKIVNDDYFNNLKDNHHHTQDNNSIDLQVTLVDDLMDDKSFKNLLINSDLFIEFNIDKSFKESVIEISIQNAKLLQNNSFGKLNNFPNLMNQFKAVVLRNYFLNLLVASQTLFEYHYTTNDLLLKNSSSLDSSTTNNSNSLKEIDKKWLWENIRERNFNKIKIFDA